MWIRNRLDSLKELHITVLNNNINRIEIEFYNENETYVAVEKKKLQMQLWGIYKSKYLLCSRSFYAAEGNEIKLKSIKPKLAGDV